MRRYMKIWWLMTSLSSQISLTSRFGAIIFVIGKILRFTSFILFIFILSDRTKLIQGYTFWEMIFFFITFTLIDTIAQFFLREVYRFRYYVVSGNFDYTLTKPLSPLFRSLFGGSDILDLSIIVVSLIFLIYSALKLENINTENIVFYILLVINALILAISFHVVVLAIGILTTTVDNAIMLYRDLTQMGRFPIDIYNQPLRSIITFVIPIGIMMTFPAKVFLGLLNIDLIFFAFFIGALFLFLSIKFWFFSLRHYTGISS